MKLQLLFLMPSNKKSSSFFLIHKLPNSNNARLPIVIVGCRVCANSKLGFTEKVKNAAQSHCPALGVGESCGRKIFG